MKARLLVAMAGPVMFEPGHIIEGDFAVRAVAAGFAEVIEEKAVSKKETATRSVKRETR